MRYLFKCCEERERIEKGLDTVQWEVKCTPFDKEDKALDKSIVNTLDLSCKLNRYSVLFHVKNDKIHYFKYIVSCILGKFNLVESGKVPFSLGSGTVFLPECIGVGLATPVHDPIILGAASGYCDVSPETFTSNDGFMIGNGTLLFAKKLCPYCYDWFYRHIRNNDKRRLLIEGEMDTVIRQGMMSAATEWVRSEVQGIKNCQENLKFYIGKVNRPYGEQCNFNYDKSGD